MKGIFEFHKMWKREGRVWRCSPESLFSCPRNSIPIVFTMHLWMSFKFENLNSDQYYFWKNDTTWFWNQHWFLKHIVKEIGFIIILVSFLKISPSGILTRIHSGIIANLSKHCGPHWNFLEFAMVSRDVWIFFSCWTCRIIYCNK